MGGQASKGMFTMYAYRKDALILISKAGSNCTSQAPAKCSQSVPYPCWARGCLELGLKERPKRAKLLFKKFPVHCSEYVSHRRAKNLILQSCSNCAGLLPRRLRQAWPLSYPIAALPTIAAIPAISSYPQHEPLREASMPERRDPGRGGGRRRQRLCPRV